MGLLFIGPTITLILFMLCLDNVVAANSSYQEFLILIEVVYFLVHTVFCYLNSGDEAINLPIFWVYLVMNMLAVTGITASVFYGIASDIIHRTLSITSLIALVTMFLPLFLVIIYVLKTVPFGWQWFKRIFINSLVYLLFSVHMTVAFTAYSVVRTWDLTWGRTTGSFDAQLKEVANKIKSSSLSRAAIIWFANLLLSLVGLLLNNFFVVSWGIKLITYFMVSLLAFKCVFGLLFWILFFPSLVEALLLPMFHLL